MKYRPLPQEHNESSWQTTTQADLTFYSCQKQEFTDTQLDILRVILPQTQALSGA